MEDLSVVVSLEAICSTCRLDTWVQTQGPFSLPAPVAQSGLLLRASYYPAEGKALVLQSQARLAGGEMQLRPPRLGTHPPLFPSVLASIPGHVGWGDFCGRWLHTPDLPGVLCDGSVAGELARACNVPDHFPSPLPGVLGRGEATAAVSFPCSSGAAQPHRVPAKHPSLV